MKLRMGDALHKIPNHKAVSRGHPGNNWHLPRIGADLVRSSAVQTSERRNGFPVLIAQLAHVWNEQHWDLEAPGASTKRVSYFLRETGQSPQGLSLARGLWPGRRRRQVCLREHHPQALSLHSPVLSLSQRRGRDRDDLPEARKCLVPRSGLEDPWDQADPEEVKANVSAVWRSCSARSLRTQSPKPRFCQPRRLLETTLPSQL